MIDTQMPLYYILYYVHSKINQSMYVRWGSTLSNVFQVTTGVRQGEILSPMLFNLYINGLSIRLTPVLGVLLEINL